MVNFKRPWFNFDWSGLLKETPRTVFRVMGNRIMVRYIQEKRFKEVKFKNSTKLKKFFERYFPKMNITYAGDGIYLSPNILTFEEVNTGIRKR